MRYLAIQDQEKDTILPHGAEGVSQIKKLNLVFPTKGVTNDKIIDLHKRIKSQAPNDESHWVLDISLYKSMMDAQLQLQNLPININTNMFWIQTDAKSRDTMFWEIYKLHPTSVELKVHEIGTWTKQNKLQFIPQQEKLDRRSNLEVCL